MSKEIEVRHLRKIRLSDIANIRMGQSPEGFTCNEIGVGVPLLNGPTEFTDFYPVPKQYTSDPKRFSESGEILFCVRGSTTGRMNWSNINYAIGRGLASITHKEGKELNYFLKYLIHVNLDSILKTTNGSTFPNLTSDMLASFELIVPEISTQNKISSFLSSLDSKIVLNNRINAELEAMAKTLYDYWFVQFDFPNAEGKPYKSSGGKMVWIEELKREIPEGWRTGTLLSLGEIKGGSTPPREIEEYFSKNGTPWITPRDLSLNAVNKFITRGEWDVSEEGIRAASLNIMPKGTVLLSSRAPIGYLAIAREDVTTNQGFKSFVPNKGFSTEYVYYSIKNMIPTIENYAVGSTFKEVSATTLKSIPICLANKDIVESYTVKVENIFNRQNLLETENQQLASLRDWLLPMLMNGQVRVGDVKEIKADNIVQFNVKHCDNNEKAVLGGYIIKLCNGKNFGRVKFQKLLFLAEYHCKLNLESQFKQKTAGPHDEKLIHDIERDMKRHRLFDHSKVNHGDFNQVTYTELSDAEQLESIFLECFGNIYSKIKALLSHFIFAPTDQCEIIATLYAVWNNRIIKKEMITDGLLKQDFLDWDPHKKKYKNRLDRALDWMRENNIIPDGFGKIVDKPEIN